MIVYSASPERSLIVRPGEHLVYGMSEHQPQGFGMVRCTPQGELVVNGQRVDAVVRRFEYVRKL